MHTLFWIGFGFLIAAGVWYLVHDSGFLQKVQTVQKSEPETSRRVGYRAGPVPFTEQMATLPADALLTVRVPGAGDVELQVVTRETLHGRRQYRGSKEWRLSGDDWQGVLLKGGHDFSRTDVLILHTEGRGDYIFQKRGSMGPEGFRQFEPNAQHFGHLKDANGLESQIAGSVTLPFNGEIYGIQDIGVWDVEAPEGATGHIPAGILARWVLAKADDGTAILVEDAKDSHDSVWTGFAVDLDRVVIDVLTKNG